MENIQKCIRTSPDVKQKRIKVKIFFHISSKRLLSIDYRLKGFNGGQMSQSFCENSIETKCHKNEKSRWVLSREDWSLRVNWSNEIDNIDLEVKSWLDGARDDQNPQSTRNHRRCLEGRSKSTNKKKGKKIKSCMRFVNSFVGSARLIKKKKYQSTNRIC